MNQQSPQPNSNNAKRLSHVFDSVLECCRDLKSGKSDFVSSFYLASQHLQELYSFNPISFTFALQNLNSNYSKDVNFVAKTLFLSQVLSSEYHFDQESQQVINEVSLFLALTLCKTLKHKKAQGQSLPAVISNYPAQYYELSKTVFKQRPSAFRLFTQISNVNEFKNKNQRVQTLILASLNISALNVGLLKPRVSLAFAINLVSMRNLQILNKTFFRNHISQIIKQSLSLNQTLNLGQLVRTTSGLYAFILGQKVTLSGTKKFTVVEIDAPSTMRQHELNTVPGKALLLLSVQPAIDYSILDNLLTELIEYDVVQKYNVQMQSYLTKRYTLEIPSTLNDFSKLLINSTNKQISEYLESRPETATIIQDYATNLARIHTPIKDLKHAAALIGLAKLYPVVCNSEILKYHRSSHFLGSREAFNKAELLLQITIKLAQDLRCDIPEYLGTVSLILYHSVLVIPRGRLSATAGKLENKQASNNLAEFFNISDSGQWMKITGKSARDWQLPASYLSLCKDYFHFINDKLDPNALPRQAKMNLAVLLMSHWMFIQIQSGAHTPANLPRNNLFKNILGYSGSEILSAYRDVIETLSPKTDLR